MSQFAFGFAFSSFHDFHQSLTRCRGQPKPGQFLLQVRKGAGAVKIPVDASRCRGIHKILFCWINSSQLHHEFSLRPKSVLLVIVLSHVKLPDRNDLCKNLAFDPGCLIVFRFDGQLFLLVIVKEDDGHILS